MDDYLRLPPEVNPDVLTAEEAGPLSESRTEFDAFIREKRVSDLQRLVS